MAVDEDALRVAVDELVLAGIRAMHAIPNGEVRSGCVVQDGKAVKERLRKAVLGLTALSPVRSAPSVPDDLSTPVVAVDGQRAGHPGAG